MERLQARAQRRARDLRQHLCELLVAGRVPAPRQHQVITVLGLHRPGDDAEVRAGRLGVVDKTVDKKLAAEEGLLKEIEAVGISMKEVTEKLLVDGIASFQKSFDELIAGLDAKVGSLAPGGK